MSRLSIAAVVAAGVLAVGLTGHARPQGRSDLALAALASHAHVSDQVLVQFHRMVGNKVKDEVLGRIGARRQEVLVSADWRDDFKGDLELVRLPPGLAVAAAVRGLEEDPNVEFAEPNWVYTHDATSNDTYYTNGSLWGMYGSNTLPKNVYGSQAGAAWAANHTGASTVYVGIIDEGYMYTHEDLAANAGTNPGEIAGNGKDDDGNGYVDDVYGWDFDKNDNTVFDGTGDDHGTHVAGTIGAVGGNGKGVAGVCWTVKLLDAKFLGKRGGTTANAVKAVDYFTNLRTAGVNIVATNNSWGGGGFSQALQDAITRAGTADILFIAAAGNDGRDIDASPSYPASYPNANIISVASITSTGGLSSFSNWGKTSVDIGAPGSGIYSSVPKSSKGNIVSGYASYSGTSMATPHVTGAAALYASTHPGATATQIKAAILGAATATTSLNNKSVTGGRLNVSGF
jgi:subtilisin family serine protease